VDTPSEDTSDEELADLMAEPDDVDNADSTDGKNDSPVEVGIPPSLNDEDGEFDASEESFSINDFEEDFHPQGETTEVENTLAIDDSVEENSTAESLPVVKEGGEGNITQKTSVENGGGDVAEFRQTLASLSRQLELDRLTFLHKSLRERGEEIPSLNAIASDITGKKLLKPIGDCDQFGKRPSARLEGWVSGLSFGANKRAKKFSK
jgi:hypothetical protein